MIGRLPIIYFFRFSLASPLGTMKYVSMHAIGEDVGLL